MLLDPKGPLSKVLSSSAIKMVNDEVSKVQVKPGSSAVESISYKRGKSREILNTDSCSTIKLARELLSNVLLHRSISIRKHVHAYTPIMRRFIFELF